MQRGRFGLPRPIGVGPLAPGGILYGQPENSEQMLEEIESIVSEMSGVELDTQDPDDIVEVTQELSRSVFPDSERKQSRFIDCTTSDWGENWSEGLLGSTQEGDDLPLEELAMAASGCRGMVNANTLDI